MSYQLDTENWKIEVNDWVGVLGIRHIDFTVTDIYEDEVEAVSLTNTLKGGHWCIDLKECEGIPFEVLKTIVDHIDVLNKAEAA